MREQRSKREQNAIQTRIQIIGAGLRLFQNPGYFKTDIRSIAKEAGISSGAFYNYFSDKLELYRAVFSREYTLIAERLQTVDISRAESPEEMFHSILEHHLKGHTHTPLFYREAAVLSVLEPSVASLESELAASAVKGLKFFLENSPLSEYVQPKKKQDIPLGIILRTVDENVHSVLDQPEPVQNAVLTELTDMLSGYLFQNRGVKITKTV